MANAAPGLAPQGAIGGFAELSMVLPLDCDCCMSEFSPLGSATSVSRANSNSAEALFFRTLVQAAMLLPAVPVAEEARHG